MKIIAKTRLLFFLILTTNNLYSIVILVHGSFASQSEWHKPSGSFYETLKKSAQALNKKTVSFTWSGRPTYKKISLAGKNLAELIKSYPINEEIILIGHSHGGNVIAHATQCLEKKDQKEEKAPVISFASLYQKPTELICSSPLYSLKKYLFRKQLFVISKIYLLGTPIDPHIYPINFDYVQQLYNFYSSGDLIQSVAGYYTKEYPVKYAQNRITNLQITLEKSGYFASEHPTHIQLHHEEIAKWLLFIPEQLKACSLGGFGRFENGVDAKIALKHNNFPVYTQKKEVVQAQPLST